MHRHQRLRFMWCFPWMPRNALFATLCNVGAQESAQLPKVYPLQLGLAYLLLVQCLDSCSVLIGRGASCTQRIAVGILQVGYLARGLYVACDYAWHFPHNFQFASNEGKDAFRQPESAGFSANLSSSTMLDLRTSCGHFAKWIE